jgi:hypothetical protein
MEEKKQIIWEKFTIDDLNKLQEPERTITLQKYHIWLWEQRKKPKKAQKLKEQLKQTTT